MSQMIEYSVILWLGSYESPWVLNPIYPEDYETVGGFWTHATRYQGPTWTCPEPRLAGFWTDLPMPRRD